MSRTRGVDIVVPVHAILEQQNPAAAALKETDAQISVAVQYAMIDIAAMLYLRKKPRKINTTWSSTYAEGVRVTRALQTPNVAPAYLLSVGSQSSLSYSIMTFEAGRLLRTREAVWNLQN
jgi:hypothetical protein